MDESSRAVLADYRESHNSPNYGQKYSEAYKSGYYAAQWRDLEIPILTSLFTRSALDTRSCLDFACGTGRIATLASKYFDRVVAVDIAAPMIEQVPKIDNVSCILRDITLEKLSEHFDVITAFRFFLNAQESLRIEAIRAMHSHLKPGGILICNNHMNSSSPMGIAYQLLSSAGLGNQKTLSTRHLSDLLEGGRFSVSRIIPYSFLPRPGPLLSKVTERLVLPVEKCSKFLKVPGSLAQAALLICRRN
jgi:SAM-dependent methyltransferase